MNHSIFDFKLPKNEPIFTYAPGTPEREALKLELARQQSLELEIPLIIGGQEVKTGKLGKVVMPHNHQHVLATYQMVTAKEVAMAIKAAMQAKKIWSNMPWEERAHITLKAADLLAGKYRYVINAATMLGQSK
ncbi:MAG: aldehyde dehydrogenase family protein, partial [Verrucomicrobia bacterium]|nr:aldehyde dehydrogenase family protein [Verrucomicrobiota bacterium]